MYISPTLAVEATVKHAKAMTVTMPCAWWCTKKKAAAVVIAHGCFSTPSTDAPPGPRSFRRANHLCDPKPSELVPETPLGRGHLRAPATTRAHPAKTAKTSSPV